MAASRRCGSKRAEFSLPKIIFLCEIEISGDENLRNGLKRRLVAGLIHSNSTTKRITKKNKLTTIPIHFFRLLFSLIDFMENITPTVLTTPITYGKMDPIKPASGGEGINASQTNNRNIIIAEMITQLKEYFEYLLFMNF